MGLKKGAKSFVHKVTKGAADGAARLTVGATTLLETVGGGTHDTLGSKFANQPSNLLEGFQDAYTSLSTQLKEAKDNIVVIPLEQFQTYGARGYVTAMMKAVPLAIIKPMIGTTDGMSKVILGAKNQINKQDKILSDNKYGANTGGKRKDKNF